MSRVPWRAGLVAGAGHGRVNLASVVAVEGARETVREYVADVVSRRTCHEGAPAAARSGNAVLSFFFVGSGGTAAFLKGLTSRKAR